MRIQDLTLSTRTALTSNDLIVVDEYQSAGVYTTKKITADKVASSRPYKVLSGLISQSGTNAPTLTILENTFNGTPVLTYNSVGSYKLRLTGEITANKFFGFVGLAGARITFVGLSRLDNNYVQIDNCVTLTDQENYTNSLLNGDYIEIRVYN